MCTDFFKNFEKGQAISLEWYAAQQQTSISRGLKFEFFIQNIAHDLMNLVLSFKSER